MSPLKELRKPVAGLTRLGVIVGAVGSLTTLVPFAGLAEFGRILLEEAPADTGRLTTVAVVIVAALITGALLNMLALGLTHVADARLQALLRRRMVDRLGAVPLGWYTDVTSGQVRKAAQDDVEELHHLVAHHDVEMTGAIVLPLGGVAYLCWLDWRLALLAIVTLPVYLFAYASMMRGFADKMRQLDSGFAKVSAAIVEFVHGITVVKAFGQAGRAHRGYRRAVVDYGERYAGWVRPILKLEALTSLALSAPVIALVSLAGGTWFVSEGWVSPVDVLAEVLVAMIIPSTLLTLNSGFTAQRKAEAAAERITTLLDTPVLPVEEKPEEPEGHLVEFDHVSFGYNEGETVLADVSLICHPGTVTALVGSSGAGKSTLAKLVPRFYDVTGGAVRLGGVDVRKIAPEVLYRKVGFVLQDVQLLHGSVADNVRLGRPQATDAEVEAAAEAARIHDRILALPRGYDSVVGEDAVFSGGEAQRISIARALLADTPVLVLDEATAYADAESEARIQQALSTLARGRTVLVIAHRLATIAGADRIAVLDGGKIAESGTHEELLTADGRYARMWHAHAGAEEGVR
ncbi:ABC transporter ATP-binding protein [Amycolatopsis regifaucium]|uniref:ABC transporter n=1 Tax=Amycolatopsis regifaucium TaxID=546365 RepID=A0A154MHH1_9PSEU|nr:ABC transporter ATP-binding protein [Amycolatopsis regifaucium]KZB83934.1 ABC transporter [Amycolatopsis regifaucium]OKA06624.1 ABC transporter [Amycolatopsis regifaucium]SFH22051.1 ATP-binding cassette, subfamily B [Amycolatopsis regifaucium]